MAFKKIAFVESEHKKITKFIMGSRFDNKIFDEVHSFIDGKGGFNHRSRHGHDKKAEEYIYQEWGDVGVEIFQIHIISDRVHQNLGHFVELEYEKYKKNLKDFPYYGEDEILYDDSSNKQRAADPNARIISIL